MGSTRCAQPIAETGASPRRETRIEARAWRLLCNSIGMRAVNSENGRHTDPIGGAWRGPDPASTLANVRILVVDDDADARFLLERIFTRRGAIVREAASAPAAFALLRDFRPQLVVSDIDMPVEDGYCLMRRIRALTAEEGGMTLSVALTANSGDTDRWRAMHAGFTAHLAKPVAIASLIELAVALTSGAH